jgi:DNA-binding transcriptional ArsR family regulator
MGGADRSVDALISARRRPGGPAPALQPFRAGTPLRAPEVGVKYNRMVVDTVPDEAVDDLFHALSDATRRDILRRCAEGDPSVSRLAEAYPMSFAAVQKHVAVLERAGLITKERRGREQLVRTDFAAVDRVRHVLDELERTWRGRAERMSDLLAAHSETGTTKSEEGPTG